MGPELTPYFLGQGQRGADAVAALPWTGLDGGHVTDAHDREIVEAGELAVALAPEPAVRLGLVVVVGRYGPGAGGEVGADSQVSAHTVGWQGDFQLVDLSVGGQQGAVAVDEHGTVVGAAATLLHQSRHDTQTNTQSGASGNSGRSVAVGHAPSLRG